VHTSGLADADESIREVFIRGFLINNSQYKERCIFARDAFFSLR